MLISFGVIFILAGLACILLNKQLAAWGRRGRWADFRLFDSGRPIKPSKWWWVYLVSGSLLAVAVLAFVIVNEGPEPGFALAIIPGLLIRTGIDKKLGRRPDLRRWDRPVWVILGIVLVAAGLALVVARG